MNPILIEFYFYKTLPIFPNYKWNYDKYQKVYDIESFEVDFEDPIFNIFRRPLYNFYKQSLMGDFFESNAMERNGNEVAFHAEFDNILFFYLYNSIKSFLYNFYKIIENKFAQYKDTNGNYIVPIDVYNITYEYLKQDPSIYNVFKFFIETRTNSIDKINDNIFINILQMKSFDKEFEKYKFI